MVAEAVSAARITARAEAAIRAEIKLLKVGNLQRS